MTKNLSKFEYLVRDLVSHKLYFWYENKRIAGVDINTKLDIVATFTNEAIDFNEIKNVKIYW